MITFLDYPLACNLIHIFQPLPSLADCSTLPSSAASCRVAIRLFSPKYGNSLKLKSEVTAFCTLHAKIRLPRRRRQRRHPCHQDDTKPSPIPLFPHKHSCYNLIYFPSHLKASTKNTHAIRRYLTVTSLFLSPVESINSQQTQGSRITSWRVIG